MRRNFRPILKSSPLAGEDAAKPTACSVVPHPNPPRKGGGSRRTPAMKFGEIPTSDAAGAVLAHSIRAKGIAFKKGRVLSAADVAALAEAGIPAVTGAQLGPDDIAGGRGRHPHRDGGPRRQPGDQRALHRTGQPVRRGARRRRDRPAHRGPEPCRRGDHRRHRPGMGTGRTEADGRHHQDHPLFRAEEAYRNLRTRSRATPAG